MCATRSGDIIDATRRGADRWHAGSAHFGAVRDPAEEPLVAAREVEAVAPGYGEDEQHFLEWLVLSLLLGRGVGYRCQQEYCPPRLHALRVTCCPAPRMRSGNALPSKRLHAELPASPWPDARGRVTRALRTESPPGCIAGRVLAHSLFYSRRNERTTRRGPRIAQDHPQGKD